MIKALTNLSFMDANTVWQCKSAPPFFLHQSQDVHASGESCGHKISYFLSTVSKKLSHTQPFASKIHEQSLGLSLSSLSDCSRVCNEECPLTTTISVATIHQIYHLPLPDRTWLEAKSFTPLTIQSFFLFGQKQQARLPLQRKQRHLQWCQKEGQQPISRMVPFD